MKYTKKLLIKIKENFHETKLYQKKLYPQSG